MPASQAFITDSTPMGASLLGAGATFRVWAPGAEHVYLALDAAAGYLPRPEDELARNPVSGHWTGFFPGVADGTRYRFFVIGPGGSGLKRDPWARELDLSGYPECDCIVRDPASYPWHDQGFAPPPFNDLVVYQFHVGVFYARDDQGRDLRSRRAARFLDVLDRVEYLADLGVNALQPLPVVEFPGEWSMGYNGTDIFSPERDYSVPPGELPPYLDKVNALLAKKGFPGLAIGQLTGQVNQLKALIDVCHLNGLAVLVDVVYNHAGGNLDAQSIDYFDFPASRDPGDSIYFSPDDWAGGRVFAFQRPEVQEFLIGNASLFVDEYHADGLRFDEVTVIDAKGGWSMCQRLTQALRERRPAAALIAEYWGEQRWRAIWNPPDGMGFDIGYADALRDGVRGLLRQVSAGAAAPADLGQLRAGLERPWNVPLAWQAYNCIENHDLVLDADGDHRHPRIPELADGSDPRSWYARSRARVATALLLTAPGVPMMFMGQEFLEEKLWSDDPHRADCLIWWDGLAGADRHMGDFHQLTRDLIWLRRRHPALRSDPITVYPPDNDNRVLAFQRWVPDAGRDVVVVASLRESTFHDHSYPLGFPQPGHWHEVFNSDFYDCLPNPAVEGNPGGIDASGPPANGLPHSGNVTVPANSVLVFARDLGD
jgi:1,4-alpha-glucan branching enzyme